MMDELPRERLGGSIDAVSQLEYAFEITKQYTKERKAFDESISQKQAIRYFQIELANIHFLVPDTDQISIHTDP